MLLDGLDARSVGLDAASNLDLARRAPGCDAQSDGGKIHHDTFDQRRTGATECFDASVYDEPADRLADLNADSSIGVGDDAVELREVHRAGIDIEAPSTLAEGFDRRVDFQFMHDA